MGLIPPDPPWLALHDADRRFTLDDVRTFGTRLRAPRTTRSTGSRSRDRQPRSCRSSTNASHRGDWVFPSGRVDVDRGEVAEAAACRGVEEELGIPASRVALVGGFDTHGPIVTGFCRDSTQPVRCALRPRNGPEEVARMVWEFSTDPEFQAELDRGEQKPAQRVERLERSQYSATS